MKTPGRLMRAREGFRISVFPGTGTLFLAAALSAGAARADVPAGYLGKPYGGTPRALPGRIDFEDYDLGGPNVAWKHDNKSGFAGSHAGGREGDGEAQHPSFYSTNANPAEPDLLADGTPYPSAAAPKSTYIGASHNGDWVNVTVRAAEAGDYWLSSHFASEGAELRFSVSFNGANKTGNLVLPGTRGYHNWRPYRNFAKVSLDSGTQVMQFKLNVQHINWDYLFLSRDSAAVVTVRTPRRRTADPLALALVSSGRAGKGLLAFTLSAPGPATLRLLDPAGRVLGGAQAVFPAAGPQVLAFPAPKGPALLVGEFGASRERRILQLPASP